MMKQKINRVCASENGCTTKISALKILEAVITFFPNRAMSKLIHVLYCK